MNVYDICKYGFTEIINNAIEHSQGTKIIVKTNYKNDRFTLCIQDNGVGIFRNIYEYFQLDDLREAILQLSKGKLTTDPAHHSGEGIFLPRSIRRFRNLCK